MTPLRVGTRGSALALAQARWVADRLEDAEIVEIVTSGDRARGIGDKSRWVDTIEAALVAGEIDLAVHSAKDVPAALADGCALVATPPRASAVDVLVRRADAAARSGAAGCGAALAGLPEGARVGTSSLRRRAQLLSVRPDLEVVELRGNVDTRLRKLDAGEVDAIVLAAAGLERLGLERDVTPLDFVPAPGQGTLAIEARADDERVRSAVGAVHHAATFADLEAERAAVRVLAATCHTPVGIHAHDGTIRGFVGLPDGSAWVADELPGSRRRGARPAHALRRAPATCSRRRRRWRDRSHLVGAGPGRPGAADRPRGRADRHGRRRPLRPPDPGRGARHARADAELVYVGKQGGGPQMPQEEIDRLLVEHGRSGRRVVRLKGGDPFVFGRGGEEALVLREAGVEFEIVPGVTAGVAAPAYAGIPVTHRELASGVAFVTGHEDPDKPGLRARLGRARALPRHARLLHGRARAAADRRAAAGGGTRRPASPSR